jgi:hypothetical protein
MSSLTTKKLAHVITDLSAELEISTLVETGTFEGRTTAWAARNFEHVITVEIDADTRRATQAKLSELQNIMFLEGCSRDVMPGAVAGLNGKKTCFWLDAHKGGGYFGSGDDCPLLEEIECVHALGDKAYVFIDDARGFLKPPPPPFDWRYWPSLSTVMAALNAAPDPRYVMVVDDVIISVPAHAQNATRTALWRHYPDL